MPEGLNIVTLGGLDLSYAGTPVTGLASRKAEALLIYLACTRRPVARDVLADLLWDDIAPDRARGNLSVLLTSLRQRLAPYLEISRQSVSFNAAPPWWLDAVELERALSGFARGGSPTLAPDEVARVRAALQLYHGDFLQGFGLRDSAGFEAWMRDEQERLRHLAVAGAQALIGADMATGAYAAAQATAMHLLRLEPFHEAGHRQLMRLFVYTGQRGAALSQYDACRRLLAAELGVEPSAETTALYEQIVAGALPVPGPGPLVVKDQAPQRPAVRGLPFQATPFIGRDAERAHIAARLADPECRLLTLLGPGGMGKTRLAIQGAAEHASALADGAVFVALESVGAPRHVAAALTSALELPASAADDPAAQLLAFLRDKQMLLVLDNFEHLLDSAELVNDLLIHAPLLKIMVTSRERLHLRAEWLLDVGGLSYPADGTTLTADAALAYSALQLFAHHAGRVQPQFTLSREHLDSAIQICHLAEGMPLAIELAAAATRDRSCAEIAADIARNLDVLATRLRDVPARHRSVRAVFLYSWDLLAPDERALLCRLAVFRGGCSPAAAEAIAGGPPERMAALADQSLLRRGADERYSMHELVRQFAAEQWHLQADAATRAAVHEAHSRWYLTRVSEHGADLHGRAAVTALQELRPDLDNIRRAWSDAVEQARASLLGGAAASLARLYDLAGLFAEGVEAFRAAADALQSTDPAVSDPQRAAAYCAVLVEQARFQSRRAQYAAAIEVTQAAYEHAVALREQHLAARALLLWGETLWHQARYAEAQERLMHALEAARAAGIMDVEADCLLNLGVVAESLGEYGAMQSYQTQALQLYEQSGDLRGMSLALNNLAGVAYHLGAYDESIAYLRRALEVCHRAGDRYNESRVYNNLGEILALQGDFAQAQTYLEQALQIKRALGDRRGESFTLRNLGNSARQLGAYGAAQSAYEQSLRITREIGYRLGEAQLLAALALVFHQVDAQPRARQYAEHALVLAREVGAPAIEASALTNLGHALLALREPAAAAGAYTEALALRQALGHLAHEMEVRAGLARTALAQGHEGSARAQVETIMAHLGHGTLHGTAEPFRVYHTCYAVLAARHDPRSRPLARQARHTLEEQAAMIADPALRESFRGIPIHRAILALERG